MADNNNNNSSTSDPPHLDLILEITHAVSHVLVLLPVSSLGQFLGFQRWRRHRASSSPSAVTDSDFFAHSLAAMELVGVAGYVSAFYGELCGFNVAPALVVARSPRFGQTLFPIFTCVEHYLGVARPVAYLQMKRGKGPWLRYLGSLTVVIFTAMKASLGTQRDSFLLDMGFRVFCVCFCCLSALGVLGRSRPGSRV